MLSFNVLICLCLFSQGSGGARRSVLLDSDEPLEYFYDDVRTVYEGFQRGMQVSSEHRTEFVWLTPNDFHSEGVVFLQKGIFVHVSHLFSIIIQVSLSPTITSPE